MKHKPLTLIQLENIKSLIAELQRPIELEELYNEVKEYFERQPTDECRQITPRTMISLLNKFIRIMEGER